MIIYMALGMIGGITLLFLFAKSLSSENVLFCLLTLQKLSFLGRWIKDFEDGMPACAVFDGLVLAGGYTFV